MIEYRNDCSLPAEAVAALFDASGIRRPSDDLARIGRMFVHADLVISAWHGERLVGVCRALTDFSYCCYLSDLAVDRSFQRQGIGRELVARVQAAIGEQVSLLLLAAPEALDYYPRLGFDKIDNAFLIKRLR
jgi:GNAT superfamily N-acetyltransferase